MIQLSFFFLQTDRASDEMFECVILSLLSRVVYKVDAFHAVMAVQWESFKTNKFAIKDIATMKCFSAKILKQ